MSAGHWSKNATKRYTGCNRRLWIGPVWTEERGDAPRWCACQFEAIEALLSVRYQRELC